MIKENNPPNQTVVTLESPTGYRVPAQIKNLSRALAALEMRKQGYSYRQIAVALGYKYSSQANSDIKQALKYVLREPAEAVRRLELDRLDTMLTVLWPKVLSGNLNAMDRVLRIMEKRSKLLGLDAPPKSPVESKTQDQLIRIIESTEAGEMLKDGTLFSNPDMGEYDPQFAFSDDEPEDEVTDEIEVLRISDNSNGNENRGGNGEPLEDEWDDLEDVD